MIVSGREGCEPRRLLVHLYALGCDDDSLMTRRGLAKLIHAKRAQPCGPANLRYWDSGHRDASVSQSIDLAGPIQAGCRPPRQSTPRTGQGWSSHNEARHVMILRRILVSTLSRYHRPRIPYFQNASFHRPHGSRPITLGSAALALSTAVGLVYLDSDAVRNKGSTVGVYPIFLVVCFFSNPIQLNQPRPSNSQLLSGYHPRELFRNSRYSAWAWASYHS
jgi:hypothetical protein